MANVKISDLPVASNVANADTFPFVQGTATKQVAKSVLFNTPAFTGSVNLADLTASTSLALDVSKNIVSVTNTGSGNNVLATSPVLVTPNLGTPSAATLTNATGLPIVAGTTGTLSVARGGTGVATSTGSGNVVLSTSPTLVTPSLGTPSAATLTNATGLPISTGVSGLGTGVATALGTAIGSAGAFVANGGALGTPSSGTVTNLTGTASININGTVGATTPNSGAFTTLSATGSATAASFIPTSSSIPTNGMYLGGTNQISFSTNSIASWHINSNSQLIFAGSNGLVSTYSPRIISRGQTIAQPGGSFQSSDDTVPAMLVWNSDTAGDNILIQFATEATYTARGSIDYNRAGGLVRYNTTSDYRAKDIIGPVQNPGATIDALKVYEGVMKGATQSRPMLVAHEAQEHVPYAVSGVKDEMNEDGVPRFQQMDVSSLVPLLVAEIQFLRARVAALELR